MNIKVNTTSTKAPYDYCDSAWVSMIPRVDYRTDTIKAVRGLFEEWIQYVSGTEHFREAFNKRLADGLPGYDHVLRNDNLFTSVIILVDGTTYAIFRDLDGENLYYMQVDIHRPDLVADEDVSIITVKGMGPTRKVTEIRTHYHHLPMCEPAYWCNSMKVPCNGDSFKRIIKGYNTICKPERAVIGVIQYNT
ncbi:MAG: hypothetical protein NC114_06405 [Ruminococcus flavefaciens]|nr:hypothetical protein [Ruminococcus flavefaciens]